MRRFEPPRVIIRKPSVITRNPSVITRSTLNRVIPAKAGTQDREHRPCRLVALGSRFRGNDDERCNAQDSGARAH